VSRGDRAAGRFAGDFWILNRGLDSHGGSFFEVSAVKRTTEKLCGHVRRDARLLCEMLASLPEDDPALEDVALRLRDCIALLGQCRSAIEQAAQAEPTNVPP